MKSLLKKVGYCFAAGCLGGVAMNVVNLVFGIVNIPEFLGVDMAQDVNANSLYSDLFWGGIWGLLFLIPLLKDVPLVRGVLVSIVPSLAQLFIFLPLVKGVNFLEGEFRLMLPVYVFLLNSVWGIVASSFLFYTNPNK
ncbi:MAG: hypothetical protein VX777_01365 [Chlamydiota bacterium]|nr:hypothetical protein [Chlamydiota bacterium]